MTLRRRDLVQQFEDVVKQEIINHNKVIEDTFAHIRRLSSENSCLEQYIDEAKKAIEASLFSLDERVRANRHDIDYNRRGQEARINDVEKQIICLKEEIHSLKKQKENLLSLYEKAQLVSLSNSEIARELRRNLEGLKVYINESIASNNKFQQHKLDVLEDKIMNRKDPIPEVKEALEKKISEAKVDKDGVTREMKVDRRHMFILERKVEDLYRRIEKLQGDS